MSDLLEFRLLKYIVAVAETANFTRASERLFLAQPTLSQQVIALEEGIGVRIFTRRREGIHLTPAGQMLYAYAQEMLGVWQALDISGCSFGGRRRNRRH